MHDDPRANHLRIVEHQQLAFGQHVADVGEMRFADLPAAVNQQFRGAALGQRELGDPPVGQVVIEFVYIYMPFIHGHKCTFFFASVAHAPADNRPYTISDKCSRSKKPPGLGPDGFP